MAAHIQLMERTSFGKDIGAEKYAALIVFLILTVALEEGLRASLGWSSDFTEKSSVHLR
ncbi:uncharacterized protein CLUP02_15984 [Colletotrichum lupini]|uniref:Uncharacterized protein n=1 Tax=Colletotrichum lupini TaxID=145971 RepID=A0A9Q8T736_9PEZI|nr:uncharacterized protein CLUP02_15984 [Colletotrichum lupini]UQC90454.1 hypothetical protein CLUP02_15984 [Colletotrichum lupini]